MNDQRVHRRMAAALPIAAAIAALMLAAPGVHAQGIMHTPNLNVGSRVPTVSSRINPNLAGRTTANTAAIAAHGVGAATATGKTIGAGNIAKTNIANTNVANTAVGKTTTNLATATGKTTTSIGNSTPGRTTTNIATTTAGRTTTKIGTTTAGRTTTNVGATTPGRTTTTNVGATTPGRTTTNVGTAVGTTSTTISTTAASTSTATAPSVAAPVTPHVTAVVTPNIAPAVSITTVPIVTPTVTPMIVPRVAVVVPTLPYVRYSPNLYPACTYAYRGSGGECKEQPISSVDLGGIGGSGGTGGPPLRSQNGGGPRRAMAQMAAAPRYLTDQIVAEVDTAQADDVARRYRLALIASQDFPLLGSALSLFRITDQRSVETVRTALAADSRVRSVQPNFRHVLQDQKSTLTEGDPAQYALAKLRLPEAHALSRGVDVRIAVIDSGIDGKHPELANAIAENFDALGSKEGPHLHGTGIAGAIVAHGRLMGTAPKARLLAIRAFAAAPGGAESTSFVILKSLDFAAARQARVVNMSFAGPKDPLLERGIAAAAAKGMVMVAASGNAGPKSPPLYPAAYPSVIAVSATDAHDRLFPASNRGNHIAIAAPGVDIFLPAPDGKYQMTSGTSFSAAHITGLAALMLERNPRLAPDELRAILTGTARDLGAPGRDDLFGAGEADALAAVTAVVDAAAPVAAAPGMAVTANAAEPAEAPATSGSSPAIAADKPAAAQADGPPTE